MILDGLILIAAFILGGFGRRIAGGAFTQWTGWNVGDTPVRLFFGLTIAFAGLLAGLPLVWCGGLVLTTFAGTVTGNFGGLNMGRIAGTTGEKVPAGSIEVVTIPGFWSAISPKGWLQAFAGMTLHGLLSVFLAGLGAWWLGYAWLPILASGLLCGAAYELGYRLVTYQGPALGFCRSGWPAWVAGATEIAEIIWGGLLAVGVVLAVLL